MKFAALIGYGVAITLLILGLYGVITYLTKTNSTEKKD